MAGFTLPAPGLRRGGPVTRRLNLLPGCPECGTGLPFRLLAGRHEFRCPGCGVKLCSTFRALETIVAVPGGGAAVLLPAFMETALDGLAMFLGMTAVTFAAVRILGRVRRCED